MSKEKLSDDNFSYDLHHITKLENENILLNNKLETSIKINHLLMYFVVSVVILFSILFFTLSSNNFSNESNVRIVLMDNQKITLSSQEIK